MADIAASVLARLKNKAIETGRSNQICLQLFCQEEFLRRLQHTRHVNNLILKGGLFLYVLSFFDSRTTVDIDFLLKNVPNTPEALLSIMHEIISSDTGNDYITFEVTKVKQIAVEKKYTGIGATIVARIKNTRTTFGIDFGFGDVIVPKQEKRVIPVQLNGFDSPVVNVYSIESTIAEKLDAILSLMEYTSRMKDYYDIYYLANRFNFDGQVLSRAIIETFANRNRDFTKDHFTRLLALREDAAMNLKWSAFLRKLKITEPDFCTVIKIVDDFLSDIIVSSDSDQVFTQNWNASDGRWE